MTETICDTSLVDAQNVIVTVSATTAPVEPGGTLRTDTLADSVLILMGMTVLQRLVGFTRSVLVCRWMSPQELGQWDMAFGFLILAGPLAILGLPGSFGRYVEYFRQRGQLRTFLWRTTTVTAVLSVMAAAVLALRPQWFSRFVFGDDNHLSQITLMAGGLLVIIAYMFMTELFTALRLYRVSSGLQFFNSLSFATLSVVLLLAWRPTATSMLLAYAGACLLAALAALVWVRRVWRELPPVPRPTGHREFWRKLIPFAMWVWTTNWLTNLFEIADRYMLLHFGPFSPAVAMEQVGHYHSARVVPILLVSVAGLMGSLLLPHLSHDWETGRRDEVSRRVNMTVKLFGLLLIAGGATILLASPLLFGVVFQGKYDGGLAVLPLTLAYCCWFAMALLVESYLWCSEHAGLGSLAFAVALVVNIAFNLLLVPSYGLYGAVVATALANVAGLLLVYAFGQMCGLRLVRGTWIVSALPLLFLLGPLATGLGLLTVLGFAIFSSALFSSAEKQSLAEIRDQYLDKFRAWRHQTSISSS